MPPRPPARARFLGLLLALPLLWFAAAPAAADLATVWGLVTDVEGNPLVGVDIEIVTLKGPPLTSRGTTNELGEYRLPLPAQKYDFRYTLRKDGYQPLEGSLETGLLRTGDTSIRQNFVLQFGEGSGEGLAQLAADQGERELRGSARALYNDAAAMFNAGDLEGAEKAFRRALRDDAGLTAAHVALAEIHLRRKEAKEAVAAAAKALEVNPGDRHALEIQHDAYLLLEREDEARRILDLLIEAGGSPQLAIRVFNEGVTALKGGDLDAAVDRFRQAVGLDPELIQAREALATLFMRRGEPDAAYEQAVEILAEDPLNPVGQRVLDDVERLRQEPVPAVPAPASAGGRKASPADDLVARAAALLDEGEPEPAQKLLEEALALDEGHARGHYLLGRCFVGAGDNARAREHLERFLALDPGAPEAERARQLLEVL